LDARFARDSIAPFDRPVVPDVYTIAAGEFLPMACVAQKILHLIGRVRRIDWDENRAQPQAGNVEKHDFRGFLRLNRNPVAGRDTQPHQSRSEASGQAVERCVTEVPARGRLEKQSLRLTARGGFNPFRRIGGWHGPSVSSRTPLINPR
jgi:hypothetical protein